MNFLRRTIITEGNITVCNHDFNPGIERQLWFTGYKAGLPALYLWTSGLPGATVRARVSY